MPVRTEQPAFRWLGKDSVLLTLVGSDDDHYVISGGSLEARMFLEDFFVAERRLQPHPAGHLSSFGVLRKSMQQRGLLQPLEQLPKRRLRRFAVSRG